jgi:magnesium chelatase family protein
VARTIADLQGSDNVERDHLREALSYRQTLQGPNK